MKPTFLLLAATLLSAGIAAAKDKSKDKEAARYNPADALTMGAGGTFGKAKIVRDATRLAIPQYSVDFKQATTVAVTKREKKMGLVGGVQGKAATASVTAYLETTDGELTAADFQEITDYGYHYFQRALKGAGIDTVSWSTITGAEFYNEGKAEDADDREQEQSGGQWWTSCNAHHGHVFYSGKGTGFAFGKAKRAAKFAGDVGAPCAYLNIVVDFADILVDVDVKTTGYRSTWTPSYNTIGQTTRMKSTTQVAPFMKVPANPRISLLYTEKYAVENLMTVGDIPAEMNFSDGLTEDPERAKKRSSMFSVSFSKRLESTPVVISTTKAKYIAAAKKALEAYADAFVLKASELKG